ncbi:hypothetical protein [Nocardioides sp.]|uniref:hypothetical protein n=1 Tax=Nocardioides sp. TaxID=35761 RepID=UPI003784D4C3
MTGMTPSADDLAAAWAAYWSAIDGEDWLTAKALIELSPSLQVEAARWVAADRDLDAWVRHIDDQGRGWSSTERRLFRVVAALLDPAPDVIDAHEVPYAMQMGEDRVLRGVPLAYFLELMGSWEGDFWRILTTWGTGGNNRDRPGRATVVPTHGACGSATRAACGSL